MKHKLLILLALALGMASNTRALNQVGGVYQIGTAQDLVDFATLVNTGGDNMSANAVLTNNIDMSGVLSWEPIGNWVNSCAYKGHFDGQGHKIENVNITTFTRNYHGLFGIISTGCLIENFSIYGEMTFNVQYSGTIAAYARDDSPTIRNVHSYVNITNNNVANNNSRQGGILGTAQAGIALVEQCTYSGNFSVSDPGGSANYGGIVGFIRSNADATCNITNCLFDGTLENTSSTPGSCSFGGIVGYCSSGKATITNCLSVGTVSAKAGRFGQLFGIANSSTSSTKISNCYYVGANANGIDSKTPTPNEATLVTAAQLASGELCYLLNESVSGGENWFQALEDDDYPTPNGSDKVYANGSYLCDGVTPKEGSIVTYDNTDAAIVDPHNFADGFCTVCGILDATYMTANSEGYYEIGTPAQLKWFSAWVNSSSDNTTSNAVLTADIDMGSIAATWVPIGDWNTTDVASAYKGHFNGQGHEISNFNVTTSQDYYGIFGVVSAATIENFSIRGTITNSSYSNIGVIGYSRDTSVNINNIQSYLTITNNGNDKNAGGILGRGNKGTTNIDRCAFFGTINANNKTNAGGIVGYFGNDYESIVNITNCLFDGTITSEIDNSYCGGIAGYGGTNVANVNITNCLSLGTLTAPVTGQFFGNIRNAGSSITNCYYQGGNIYGTGSSNLSTAEATAVTTEQLASGEVAYLLNGSVGGGTDWYQTLPSTDAFPYPYSTHGLVYVNGTVCPDTGTPQGTVSYGNTEGTTVGSHHPVDGFCTYCGTVDDNYMTPIDGNYMIGTSAQLKWFAAFVNAGHQSANAKLANITPLDMTGVAVEPIGNSSAAYTGTFDGQGKSIMGFSATSTGNGGLFGKINNATIKDFSISGSLTVNSGTGSGVIGWATNSNISSIHSTLNIAVPGDDAHHVAGVVGSCQGGNTVSGCSFAGTLTVTGNTRDCFGGVAGYFKNDNMTNCANYGTLSYTKSDGYVGGVVGYISNTGAHVTNSLATGTVTYAGEGTPTYGGTLIGRLLNHTAANFSNNYWLTGTAPEGRGSGGNTVAANKEATSAQLASGEVAYKLGSAWYQTIGTDANPVLDSSSEKVLYVGAAGYSTFYDADNDWALSSYNDDAKAFIGTLTPSGNGLHLEEIGDIPARTAVVIGGTYYNKVSTTATASTTGNILLGSTGYTVPEGKDIFALGIVEDAVGFYPVVAGVTIPAGKAYLDLTDTAVKEFLTFVFDDATGINEELRMKNEESSEVIYNVAGQRLGKMQKGINIVNGKKIMVK